MFFRFCFHCRAYCNVQSAPNVSWKFNLGPTSNERLLTPSRQRKLQNDDGAFSGRDSRELIKARLIKTSYFDRIIIDKKFYNSLS